jgi:sulfide:quinone oxidoreductase
MTESSPLRIVVAGGGVAGLEALLALRDLASDRVDVTLLDPASDFVFRPMATAEPFARGHARRIPLARIASDVGARLLHARLTGVDDARGVALTDDAGAIAYDVLLVAIGARSEPVYRRAITWTPESDPEIFGGLLRDLEEGYSGSIAFVVPPGVGWPLPAYELALMTAWQAESAGRTDARIVVVTPEGAPLAAFGVVGSTAVRRDLDEAGVTVETNAWVEERDEEPHFVMQPGSRPLDAERVVALPRAAGPRLDGLPADRLGFIPVDRHGRVAGSRRIFAAGDAIAFPVKQGGLAAQQADAAAQAIAEIAGADVRPEPFRPILRGILLTGRGREWLRHDVGGGDGEGAAARHALWWPPTKVAGRYLSPYLDAFEESEATGAPSEPAGEPVELDLERSLPAAADALRSPPAPPGDEAS